MTDAIEEFAAWDERQSVKVAAAVKFCAGFTPEQLEAAGSLRELVDALRNTERAIHDIWRDPVIRDRRPSNLPLLDLAKTQREAATLLAPFQGGDDGT